MATPQVQGVNQALKELGKVDKKLRRQVGVRIRSAAAPLRTAAQARIPSKPLSNWNSGRYGFDQSAAKSGVKIKLGGRSKSGGSSFGGLIGSTSTSPLVTMTQANAGGSVFDMAGRRSAGKSPQGRAFIRGLNRHGSASRSMWAAAEEKLPEVEKAVEVAVTDVSRDINRRLR